MKEMLKERQVVQQLKTTTEKQAARIALQEEQIPSLTMASITLTSATSLVPNADDEDSTIRIGDFSDGNGAGSLVCYIGGIWNNLQPVSGSVVVVTLDT